MEFRVSVICSLLVIFSLFSPQARGDASDSVFFIDGSNHQFLRHRSSIMEVQHPSMSLQEVGAAVSVLLGFAPPSTLSAASSSKLNEVLSPNPFNRPRAVFLLELNGINGLEKVTQDNAMFGNSFLSSNFPGSETVDIQLPDENDVSVVSLDDLSEDCTDKEISEFSSLIGGSYAPDAVEPLNGELTIPLENGASMNLHMSKKSERKFIVGLLSLIRNVKRAIQMHEDLSQGTLSPAELLTGCFNSIKKFLHNSMTYTSVEISPSLAEVQKETVGEVRSHIPKFRVECRDAADRSGWGHVEQQPCWVIMLEVLDNLPHDLVYSDNQISSWMEVWVERQHDLETLRELYKPLQDSLITRCVEILDLDKTKSTQSAAVSTLKSIWSKLHPKPRRCWLPTGCLKLLEVLHEVLPKMSLIASDFSYLPDVKIPGERAPLVSTKKDGSSSDYENYMEAKGDADIFFPTDFWLLERMDHYCSGWLKLHSDHSSKKGKKRRTITLETSSFMEEFGLPTKTRTKDGYNPLLDDFKNTKFYLSVPTHNTK